MIKKHKTVWETYNMKLQSSLYALKYDVNNKRKIITL